MVAWTSLAPCLVSLEKRVTNSHVSRNVPRNALPDWCEFSAAKGVGVLFRNQRIGIHTKQIATFQRRWVVFEGSCRGRLCNADSPVPHLLQELESVERGVGSGAYQYCRLRACVIVRHSMMCSEH